MDQELFGQLVQVLNEASAIAQAKPSRDYDLKLPNVKQIREQTGLSQDYRKTQPRPLRN